MGTMNRRQFIKGMAAATVAVVIPAAVLATKPERNIKFRKFADVPPEALHPLVEERGFVSWKHYYRSTQLNQQWIERIGVRNGAT